MIRIERLVFLTSIILLLIFLSNLLVGAAGSVGFLADVDEAILLFGTCIAFVIAVLFSEYRVKTSTNESNEPTLEENVQSVETNQK